MGQRPGIWELSSSFLLPHRPHVAANHSQYFVSPFLSHPYNHCPRSALSSPEMHKTWVPQLHLLIRREACSHHNKASPASHLCSVKPTLLDVPQANFVGFPSHRPPCTTREHPSAQVGLVAGSLLTLPPPTRASQLLTFQVQLWLYLQEALILLLYKLAQLCLPPSHPGSYDSLCPLPMVTSFTPP